MAGGAFGGSRGNPVWKPHARLLAGMVVVSFCATAAPAAVRHWLGGSSPDWNTPANWQGGVPGNGDDLIFTNSAAFQPANNNIAGLAPNALLFSNAAALALGGNALSLGWAGAGQAVTFGRVSGGTTATATNPAGHGLVSGQAIWVSGAGTPFDGVYQVAATPSATTFTFTVANSGATAGSGASGRAGTLANVNAFAGRDVTIANDLAIVSTQYWECVSANAIVNLNGNLTGSSNIIYLTADTRTALAPIRLAGTNAGYTGHFRPFVNNTGSGLMLMHPAAMTAGNIDLGSNDRNLWIQGGPGIGTYTFGVGGGTNAVAFRNAGQGGLKVSGADATWDPGNGGDYSTVGVTNARLRVAKSLVHTNTLYFGNSASRLVLSTNGFVLGVAESGLSVPPIVVMRFALGDDGVARPFTVGEGGSSTPGLVELTRASTGGHLGGKTLIDASASLSVSNMNQLLNGNLEIRSGAFLANGISWSEFVADRSSGYGTGADQWQLTGGGFAARGADFIIPNDTSGGLSDATFDVNFQLGLGLPATNELLYANRPVTIARSTVLTGRRLITVPHGGAGLTGAATSAVVPVVAGSLTGTGSVMVAGISQSPPLSQVAELVFSGTNAWSGCVTNVAVNSGVIFNSGPGGMHVRDALVRFDGDASLPAGNGGSPALLGALQRNAADFGFGFLLTGGATERVYDLATGMRFMIGSMSTAADPGVLGAGPGLSRLEDSTVLIHDGQDAFSATAYQGCPLAVLVRDGGTLVLGDPAGGPVRLVSSKGQDAASSLSATTPVDATAVTNRTLVKRGEGTVVLRNVSYTDVAEAANKAAQFFWHIGRGIGGNAGAAAYFDGAVRGLAPGDPAATTANSLKDFWISLRGGVYEIDNSGGGSGTFRRWVSVSPAATNISIGNISGTTALGGGGFAAYGGPVVTDLTTNGVRDMLAWGQSGSGFLQTGDPLIFGSQTANAVIEFFDSINLSNGAREFRVLDNTNSAGDMAVISGTITGLSASAVIKTGPGLLELRGTNTYAGGTVVSNGILLVNTAAGSATGTNTVTVSAGARFGGSGVVSGLVTMAGGSELLIGATTNAAVGHLRLVGGLSLGTQPLVIDMTNAAGVAGTDWDLITVGGGGGTVTFSGSPTITLHVRAPAALPGFDPAAGGSWLIVDAGSISGFDTNTFVVSTNLFAPAMDGVFVVTQSLGNLYLGYVPSTPVDLALEMSQSAALFDVGTAMSYTLTVSNAGPVASAGIVVSNRLGAAVTYVGSSGGGLHGAGVVTWTLAPMAAGASTTLTLNVNAALAQGDFTNRATVMMPMRLDPDTSNNATSLVATAICPGAPLPFLNAVAGRTVFEFHNLTFQVVASNTDCSTPFLEVGGKPAAATFTTATNGYMRTGTFSWTPGAPDVGTHPVRFYASNAGSGTNAFHLLIHVAQTGEATNSAGVPLSQTNWHVAITNIAVPASGNATVLWASVAGVAYDVYSSANNYGEQTMSWSKEVDGIVASGPQQAGAVAVASQKYVQVVPAGFSPGGGNLWALIKPALVPGFTLFAAPLTGSDLRFDGAFGTNLAAVLAGDNGGTGDHTGDEVFLLNADGSYSNLYLDGAGVWRTSGGSAATHRLEPGQGLIVLRNGLTTVWPRFSGPVGNTLSRTNTINEGNANLLTFSEGRYLTPAAAFASPLSGSPVGSYDEDGADQLVFIDDDGSFRPVQRLPDGTWLDLTTFGSAGHLFTPGRAAFYVRQSGGGILRVKF